jgi:hypothetical protein
VWKLFLSETRQPWRRGHQFPPKPWYTSKKLYRIVFQKTQHLLLSSLEYGNTSRLTGQVQPDLSRRLLLWKLHLNVRNINQSRTEMCTAFVRWEITSLKRVHKIFYKLATNVGV